MIVQHTLTVSAVCPVDGTRDFYKATLHVNRMMSVESIRAEIKEFDSQAMFQEDLTVKLAEKFCCRVETWGSHTGTETYVCFAKHVSDENSVQ